MHVRMKYSKAEPAAYGEEHGGSPACEPACFADLDLEKESSSARATLTKDCGWTQGTAAACDISCLPKQ